jgi:hypothetical protein
MTNPPENPLKEHRNRQLVDIYQAHSRIYASLVGVKRAREDESVERLEIESNVTLPLGSVPGVGKIVRKSVV